MIRNSNRWATVLLPILTWWTRLYSPRPASQAHKTHLRNSNPTIRTSSPLRFRWMPHRAVLQPRRRPLQARKKRPPSKISKRCRPTTSTSAFRWRNSSCRSIRRVSIGP